mmetsp:Transcript_23395/g.57537  ORF Transcript_23395/g.57537 Transcript_23395/m.57537 type:complete len:800 (-) Transcript_23395:1862-4261(-)
MQLKSWSCCKRKLIVLGACFVTISHSFPPATLLSTGTRRNSPIPLLYSQHASEVYGSESWLIQSIQSSQSTTDLARLMEEEVYCNGALGSSLPVNAFDRINMNITAKALRRLAHLSILETKEAKDCNYSENPENPRTQLLGSLLNQAEIALTMALDDPETLLNPYNLADILISLGMLSHVESSHFSSRLLRNLLDSIEKHEAQTIHSVGLIRMVQCLQAIARLQLEEPNLQDCIFQRLLKPDAVAKLPARTIAHGLAALANLHTNNRDSKLLSRAFMRRLRKQKVREEATLSDLLRALAATDKLFQKPEMDEFKGEAAIFGFTLLRDVIKKKSDSQAAFSSKTVSDLISTWARLSNNEREDVVIEELLNICESDGVMERCNLYELEKILVSVERLRTANHTGTMELAGERFLALVKESNQSSATEYFSPCVINSILRCPVLLHRRSPEVMKPFIAAALLLFHDVDFVNSCSLGEIANFLWFKSVARWLDEEVLHLFCQRLLDPELVDSCSPKLASRILGAFTAMMSLEPPGDTDNYQYPMAETISQIFHCYGVHLLTSRLEPAEAATALYSYAKASYFHDMGIFDHLVSSVSSMVNRCTTRQLSQSLWSCGKMVAFEQLYGHDLPPYHKSSLIIAQELCRRSNELTPPDVTQCMWALARLGVTGRCYLEPLAERAIVVSESMNTIEVVNILWGLGKTEYIATDLLLILAEKLMEDPLDASPKQAASALFALGRLNFRNKELFDKLCAILIDRIDDTSAQSIANVLWAYKTVNLRPPEELLSFWATEKLGLVGVQSLKPR